MSRSRCGSSFSATRSRAIKYIHPVSARYSGRGDADIHLSGQALRHARRPHRIGVCEHQGGTGPAALAASARGQAAGGPAAGGPDAVRPGDDSGGRLLQRHRELRPAHGGPEAGGTALYADRLFPGGFSAVYRRIARDDPADSGDVCRRPQPQRGAGGAWVSAAQRMDNRPLRFEEFQERWKQVVFVSATPAPYELELCEGEVVEQIIRPTGLVDPEIFVHPATRPDPHLMGQDREAGGGRRAGAGDDADQAAGGGSVELSEGQGHSAAGICTARS